MEIDNGTFSINAKIYSDLKIKEIYESKRHKCRESPSEGEGRKGLKIAQLRAKRLKKETGKNYKVVKVDMGETSRLYITEI